MCGTSIKFIFLINQKIQTEMHISSYDLQLMEHENNLRYTHIRATTKKKKDTWKIHKYITK